MELAAFIGISISEFWEITPFELNISAKGYSKRKENEAQEYEIKLKNEQKLLTIQAYQISRWVWAKKIDIKKILKDMDDKKVMTDNQMLERVKALNDIFGGEVKKNG